MPDGQSAGAAERSEGPRGTADFSAAGAAACGDGKGGGGADSDGVGSAPVQANKSSAITMHATERDQDPSRADPLPEDWRESDRTLARGATVGSIREAPEGSGVATRH